MRRSRSDLVASGLPPRSTRGQTTRWDTQDAAWEDAQPRVGTIAANLLASITEYPATCDELEIRHGLTHQTCSAAVNWLMRHGQIVADGTRKTRSGRSARVWIVKQPDTLFHMGVTQ